MCPNWNTTERGTSREEQFTTSYGDRNQDPDWDGKSCSDFHQLPGRGIEDVESLTMLHGLGMNAMSAESEGQSSTAGGQGPTEDEEDDG
jgi:hypothetical protein